MVVPRPTPVTKAAQPRLGNVFDPWNSSSTGHQRAEARGPSSGTGRRDSRNRKLQSQYLHGERPAGRGPAVSEPGKKARVSVMEMLARPGSMKGKKGGKGGNERREVETATAGTTTLEVEVETTASNLKELATKPVSPPPPSSAGEATDGTEAARGQNPPATPSRSDHDATSADPLHGDAPTTPTDYAKLIAHGLSRLSPHPPRQERPPPPIFASVVVYINGSTWPAISDHRLRQLLAEHGALLSLHLARRQVTHVVLGRPSTGPGRGAGGGLAAGKLEQEIRRRGSAAVKYVDVEWVLKSIKAGRRLPEVRFAPIKTAGANQRGILGAITKTGTASQRSAQEKS